MEDVWILPTADSKVRALPTREVVASSAAPENPVMDEVALCTGESLFVAWVGIAPGVRFVSFPRETSNDDIGSSNEETSFEVDPVIGGG